MAPIDRGFFMRLILLAIAFSAAVGVTSAETVNSVYTKTAGPDCKVRIEKQGGIELGSTTVCKGFGGIAVTQFEDDSRVTVSYGRKPSGEPAAKTHFGPLNGIGDMLEWRVENV